MGLIPTDEDLSAIERYERDHLPRAWAVVREYSRYAALRRYDCRWWVVHLADFAMHLGSYDIARTFEEATGLAREFAVSVAPEGMLSPIRVSSSLHAVVDDLCNGACHNPEQYRRMRLAYGTSSDWYMDHDADRSDYLRGLGPNVR